MSEFVEIVFHLLQPHTVALFISSGRNLRLEAVKSREARVVPQGHRISRSDTFITRALEEIGEIWLRELSDHARVIPIYPDGTSIHSMRIIRVPFDRDNHLLLMIDYTDSPQEDPLDTIGPLLGLFSDSMTSVNRELYLNRGPDDIPIPVFLRRILKPFIEFSIGSLSIESLGLVIWGPPASEGEILEVFGERIHVSPEYREHSFDLGPFRFRWSMGGLRKLSSYKEETGEDARYYPVIVGGDIVGNLSLVSHEQEFERNFHESLVKVISWSIQRELNLIDGLNMGNGEAGLQISNPYRAVIRVLDEWSNASRYNEYLSLGLAELRLEGTEVGLDKWNDADRIDRCLLGHVEDVLRKGDILAHCSRGRIAMMFPRTSPEGAGNAMRRLRNLLEGKKLPLSSGSIRIRSVEYTVLCYPADLPTEDKVLEKCSLLFLPQ